jgi:hypothetical protein
MTYAMAWTPSCTRVAIGVAIIIVHTTVCAAAGMDIACGGRGTVDRLG